MSLREVLGALSWRPARIARVDDRHGRPVAAREPANLTVIDMDATWTVTSHDTASRSRNTPFVGHTVRGRVRHTVLAGQPVVVNGSATR
jgi:dihydroorotase